MFKKPSIIILIGICVIIIASVFCYAVFVKQEPVVPVQPVENDDVTPTPPISPDDISDGFFTYTKNDQIFSVSKNEFNVLNKFNALELKNKSKDCGTNKSEQYFKELLSCYSKNDNGTEYQFKYKGQTQDSGIWTIVVIPNKIGYINLKEFKNDFDLCEAGSNKYPSLISEKYLLFVSSCGTGYDDGSGLPHGCEVVRKRVESTIKIK